MSQKGNFLAERVGFELPSFLQTADSQGIEPQIRMNTGVSLLSALSALSTLSARRTNFCILWTGWTGSARA
jgi:hypothetical protein